MLSQRSHQPEWMDLGHSYYTSAEYQDCLYQLDRIGRFLGGDQATFKAFKKLSISPQSILDVGCGGGLFTLRLAEQYPEANVVGIDLSKDAICFAKERLNEHNPFLPHVQFYVPNTPKLDEKTSFDIVTSTLVCHHLSDEELVAFLQQACRIAKQAIILNDLHRHPLASIGFASIVPFLFRNRMIWHDGLLSIRRAFRRQEWKNLLRAAGIDETAYTISWHWAFRWIVMIDTTKIHKRNLSL